MNNKTLVVYSENKIPHTAEYFLQKSDKSASVIIIAVFLLLFSIILFLCFGEMDSVVKVSGVIRPVVNISQIKNIIAGEIEAIYYRPGQLVQTGDVLISLKQDSLLAQKISITAQYDDVIEKLEGLYLLNDSYLLDRNIIPFNKNIAYTRFESYWAECKLLNTQTQLAQLLFNEEKKLPSSATTPQKIRNLEYEYKRISDSLNLYKKQFLETITSEMAVLNVSKLQLEQQLEQLEINIKNTNLESPMNGFVQEISSLNVGDFIFADQKILNIVPNSEANFRIELRVPAKDAGKIKKGMNVKLRFPALPFYEFKGANGVIETIDPDAQATSNGALFFTVYTTVDTCFLKDRKGRDYPLRVGLEVDSRIVIERKPIIFFLFDKMGLLV